jgi:hypothetical protein
LGRKVRIGRLKQKIMGRVNSALFARRGHAEMRREEMLNIKNWDWGFYLPFYFGYAGLTDNAPEGVRLLDGNNPDTDTSEMLRLLAEYAKPELVELVKEVLSDEDYDGLKPVLVLYENMPICLFVDQNDEPFVSFNGAPKARLCCGQGADTHCTKVLLNGDTLCEECREKLENMEEATLASLKNFLEAAKAARNKGNQEHNDDGWWSYRPYDEVTVGDDAHREGIMILTQPGEENYYAFYRLYGRGRTMDPFFETNDEQETFEKACVELGIEL